MTVLTPAEWRVQQTLLNLPNPVPLKIIAMVAVRDHIRPNDDAARHVIGRLKAKRPGLHIKANWGQGYSVRVGNPCRSCLKGTVVSRGRCGTCAKAWRAGYAAGHRSAQRGRSDVRDASFLACEAVSVPAERKTAPAAVLGRGNGHRHPAPSAGLPPR